MGLPVTSFACTGCGRAIAWDALPLGCPDARAGDDIDHVLARRGTPASLAFPPLTDEPNPFIRYRALLHPFHVARAGGMSDADYLSLVESIDRAVGAVEGRARGFVITPMAWRSDLGVWAKDETQNVSGSHKARHLMGVLLTVEILDRIGRGDAARDRPLAIASCGNAALAAAVLARAAARRLLVFIPSDAHPNVVARLEALGACVEICPRVPGVQGDPAYHRFRSAVEGGALPFCCQGPDCGLAIDGGRTLGYELVEQAVTAGITLDHVVIQVGGGALGSAVAQAISDATSLGLIARHPRLHFVQTRGCFPLDRACEALKADDTGDMAALLARAARHRSRYMRPWDTAPKSVAHGILDDETYDWRALCEAMMRTGGRSVVVDEEALVAENHAANRADTTARPQGAPAVDETGSAGLAGVMALRGEGVIRPPEQVAVIFSGARR